MGPYFGTFDLLIIVISLKKRLAEYQAKRLIAL